MLVANQVMVDFRSAPAGPAQPGGQMHPVELCNLASNYYHSLMRNFEQCNINKYRENDMRMITYTYILSFIYVPKLV